MVKVVFNKDFEVDCDLLIQSRRFTSAWPKHWTRFEVTIDDDFGDLDYLIEKWIEQNIESDGLWDMMIVDMDINDDIFSDNYIYAFCFEYEEDALLFKLLDGNILWKELRDND